MKYADLVIASVFAIAGLVAFAFLTEARLPAGTELPIHWNAAGEPDDFAPALQALLFPAAILAVLTLLFAWLPRLEPLQDRLQGSAPVLRTTWIGMIALNVLVAAIIGLPAWGIVLPVNVLMAGIGVLFLLIGNVLPKSRPGFFVGIRTPWTITDTDNWIATHRLGGKLMMLAGAAILLAALLPIGQEALAVVVLGATFLAALVPIAYSWWFWHRKGA